MSYGAINHIKRNSKRINTSKWLTTIVTSAVGPTKIWKLLSMSMNVQDRFKTNLGSKNSKFWTNGRSRLTDIASVKYNIIHENGWWTKRKATDQFCYFKTNVVILSDRQQLPNSKLHSQGEIYYNNTSYGWRQQTQNETEVRILSRNEEEVE